MQKSCCDVVCIVLLSPLAVYRAEKACNKTFWINLLFYIFTFGGSIHAAYKCYGYECCQAAWCSLLPPAGYYCSTKKCDKNFWFVLLLTFLGAPGAIFCYKWTEGHRNTGKTGQE